MTASAANPLTSGALLLTKGLQRMIDTLMSRRRVLQAAGASLATLSANAVVQKITPQTPTTKGDPVPGPSTPEQERRLKWWREARYGMFIHYGLYSLHARQEWAVEKEAIPIPEYEKLATRFNPKPGFAREWAKLAKASGMHYMVMTTKHHEGFCNFNTKLTNYNAV
jgi:alpha-L-fucosidase